MKFKYRILLPFMFLGVLATSLFTSCEEECSDCGCSSVVVDKIVSSDSLDIALQQLTPNTTFVILGKGLSVIDKAYLVGPDANGQDVKYSLSLNPSYVTETSIIITLPKEKKQNNTTYVTNRLVLEARGCSEPFVINILKPALQ